MKDHHQQRTRNRAHWGLVLCAFVVGGVIAQQLPLGQFAVSDFTFPEFHEPPNQTQLKSLLHMAEAVPQGGGRFQATGVRLETFNEDGIKEIVLETPTCTYNMSSREADSDGPLHIHTEDGRLTVDGVGFLWRQTNSSLIISNRVHTVIQWKPEDTLKP